jgi:hypothetical protein
MVWSWVEAVAGFSLIVLGSVRAFARTLPEPAWMWGRQDAATGAPTRGVRASGTAQIALGGGFVALAWVVIGPLSAGSSASYLVGLLFITCSVHLNCRASLLHRAQLV